MNDDKLSEFYHRLDRSLFLEEEYKSCAGLDEPLPIGFEQTISQPSLVFEMTRMLEVDKHCKVLEIGTGSGYQTALLAEFAGSVYTVERIEALSVKARKRLDSLGYVNIHFKVGDGSLGWKENGLYDRIIVTAAAEKIPREFIEQLKEGGKMIIPVGSRGWQELTSVRKDNEGKIHVKAIYPVTFVELKGKYGWSED